VAPTKDELVCSLVREQTQSEKKENNMNKNIISMVLNKVAKVQGFLMQIEDSANRNVLKGASIDGFNPLLINGEAYLICPEKIDELAVALKEMDELKNKLVCGFSKHDRIRYIKVFVNDEQKAVAAAAN